MALLESIHMAQQRGATPDAILNAIKSQRPDLSTSIQTALSRGADSQAVVDEIVKQNKQPEPSTLQKVGNFGMDLVKGAISPVVKTAVTGLSALEGTANLGAYGLNRALGNTQAAQQNLQRADQVTTQGYNVPGFGQVTPVSTPKGALATGAELSTLFMGGSGAAGLAEQTGKGLIKSAVKTGIKEGAVIGATGGFGSGLQQDNATAGSVGLSTVGGGITGALFGGLFAPLAARATPEARAAIATQKESGKLSQIVDYLVPRPTKAVLDEAVSKGTLGVEDASALQAGKLKPTTAGQAVAETVSGIINPKKSALQNIDAVNTAIEQKSKNEILPFLQENNAKTGVGQIENKLASIPKPSFVKTEQSVEATYDAVMRRAMDFVKKYQKTESLKYGNEINNVDLWQARKEFDAAIQKEFPRVFDYSAKDTAVQEAVINARKVLNDIIADTTPDTKFKDLLETVSKYYQAKDVLKQKAVQEFKSGTQVSQFLKAHPVATKVGKSAATALIGGEAINAAGHYLKGGQ